MIGTVLFISECFEKSCSLMIRYLQMLLLSDAPPLYASGNDSSSHVS